MELLDEPTSVRSADAFDAFALDVYLKTLELELEGTPEVAQYPGGASNLTYLLKYTNRELVLRRPPPGHKAKGAHDMMREARVMKALRPVYRYVPHVVALCEDASVIGTDFYVMDRISGIIPRRDFPAALELTTASTRALCVSVVDRLIELHQVDYQRAGLSGLGKGEGYVGRQIRGWCERYRRARTQDVPDFEGVMAWLMSRMPERDVASCIIHNDFRFDNVVLDANEPLQVIGVLDWEMATLGCPLMDLGSTLAYWVEAQDPAHRIESRLQPTHLPGMLTRAEVIDYYAQRTGLRVAHFGFYEVYGLFRLAGILQQIYYRFYHGQTDNPAFARFGIMAAELHEECVVRIAAG